MTKPSNFIQTSDYASLKNDNKGTISLYLGTSPNLNFNQEYVYESFLDIGTVNASIRNQIYTDAFPNDIWNSPQIGISLEATIYNGLTPIAVSPLNTTAYIERVSPTRVRLVAVIYGIAAGYTTKVTGKFQTVTCNVVTFLSPFA